MTWQVEQGDCLNILSTLAPNSVDLICTDPPYGISFMGKKWDEALPKSEVFKECLRVLKPGAFTFVMSGARADQLWRMMSKLEEAGFWVHFTPIFWTYATGFPKAQNIAKFIEKKHREPDSIENVEGCGGMTSDKGYKVTKHHEIYEKLTHPDAIRLQGSYGGFQPKPAVEIIIVAMKPMDEKTFVAQALKNGKGITWLDDCRVPTQGETVKGLNKMSSSGHTLGKYDHSQKGKIIQTDARFPANLLVSNDVLNDGQITGGGKPAASYHKPSKNIAMSGDNLGHTTLSNIGDSGSFSRYFDLDSWAKANLPQGVFSYDMPDACNTDCISLLPAIELLGRIPRKDFLSDLVPYLDMQLYDQLLSASFDNVVLHSTSSIDLLRSVHVLHHNLGKLLVEFSSDNSLHKRLLSNEVLCVQNLKALAGFLDGCQDDSRLCDVLSRLCEDVCPEFLLLLHGVHKRILMNLPSSDPEVSPDNICHQKLAWSLLLSCYWFSNNLNEITTYNANKILINLKNLPESAQQVFPFLIVPKPSKTEKNKGCDYLPEQQVKGGGGLNNTEDDVCGKYGSIKAKQKNPHATVKPVKLMSYLIELGSRKGDLIVDPYAGSGTTGVAAVLLERNSLCIELDPESAEICRARIKKWAEHIQGSLF